MLRGLARKEDPGKEHVRTAETLFIYFLFEFLEGKEVFFFVLGRARELICILSYTKCVCVLCVLALSTRGKWNTDSSQTLYEIVRKGVNEVINIKITFIY